MDIERLNLFEPSDYMTFLKIRDGHVGYSEDGRELTFKRFRTFRKSYDGEEARKYFIDDFCECYEKVYGTFVDYYSGLVESMLNEKYGSLIEVSREIATHSTAESHTWDDEDDEDYYHYDETYTIYITVVHSYTFKVKGDDSLNKLKLKYPELSDVGLFKGNFEDHKNDIKLWFNKDILAPCKKHCANESEIINVCKKKAGLE